MTTNLGETILVKTLIGACEGGQCGGEVTLTTDEVFAAYAVSTPDGHGFIEQDCDTVAKFADGSIVVSCAAVNPDSEHVCDGTATFTKADLNDAAWTSPTARAHLMTRMERDA